MGKDRSTNHDLNSQRPNHQACKAYCTQADHVGGPDPDRCGGGEARYRLYQGVDAGFGPDATQLVHSA